MIFLPIMISAWKTKVVNCYRLDPQQGCEFMTWSVPNIFGEFKLRYSFKKGCTTASCSCVKIKFERAIACKSGIECQNHDLEKTTTWWFGSIFIRLRIWQWLRSAFSYELNVYVTPNVYNCKMLTFCKKFCWISTFSCCDAKC